MPKAFLLLYFFLLPSLVYSEDQAPTFESLSQNTAVESVANSAPLSQTFTRTSEQVLGLRRLFEALPIILNFGNQNLFPTASLSLKKAISEKALEIASGLSGVQDEDFSALNTLLLELGDSHLKTEEIPRILFQMDFKLLAIGQKLKQNAAVAKEEVLPQINQQAALLLLKKLQSQDFSSNAVGLNTLLNDLVQVLKVQNEPGYEVFENMLSDTKQIADKNAKALALLQIAEVFESVLDRKDGKDPWHPPIQLPEDLSPTQKDRIISSALNSSASPSPGFFRRTQSAISNFLIPAAHASTTPVMATAQALTPNPRSPTNSNDSVRRRFVKLPNGSEYRGDLVGKLPHGRGWLKNPNGTSYFGDWALGRPEGHGVLRLHKGNVYTGEIHNGIPQGTGSFTAPDGSVYQGAVHNGRPHGEGKILFPNGIVIEAEFKSGVPDGISILRDGFGNTSEFSFVDGEPLGDARIFTKGLVLDGWLNGSFEAFELMGVSDRFGNFVEVFQDDAIESENDSEGTTNGPEDLPSAPQYERSNQNVSLNHFIAYDSGFRCNWTGEVSPFGQNQKLYPHGYGEITCADGFQYTGLAESYLHPTNGVISEAHGYGRVILSTKRKEAVAEIDGNFERGRVIGQARVLFDSGLVFEGRVDTTRVTLNPTVGSYRSPAAKDGFYIGSEDHPLGNNGVLYLGPVQNGYPHGYGFLKQSWESSRGRIEKCQYQSLPVFKVGGTGHRRAGYCEFENPHREEFKGYQYGDTYTINPDRTYPGPLGRGADYKNGTRWREGWYADNAHYIGPQIPADYPHDHAFIPIEFRQIPLEESFTDELVEVLKSVTWEEWVDLGTTFIPAGKFANAAVKLWDTYRLIEELKQANGLATEDEIRARLLDALKYIVAGKTLVKTLEKVKPIATRLLNSKKTTRTHANSSPRTWEQIKKDREFAATQKVLEGGTGYTSFQAFKKSHGSAGVDKEWHHIVEQRLQDKFGPEAIHNTKNLVAIPVEAHWEINRHYGRLRPGTNRRNRELVGDLSFEEQFEYGKQKMEEILRDFGQD